MEIKRLFDFIYYQAETHPSERSFGYHHGGDWVYHSTQEMIEMANKVSCGLLQLGVQPGDKIGLVTYKNRPEWVIMDLGMQQIGAINIPVYPTISPNEYEYIFNDAEVKYCFCGAEDLVDKVSKARQNVPTLKEIYSFDQRDDVPFWKDIWSDEGKDKVEAIKEGIKAEDLATIIYTSGTTGNPKGVMLSHNNIVSNVKAVQEVMPVEPGERVLSFLPLCHIFERAASYSYMYNGITVVFTGTDNLGGETGDLQAIKPHFFTTVPRLLEKVYERIYNKGLELTGIKRKLFFWALAKTDDYDFDQKTGFSFKVADKLIFSKWRDALGGNVKGILTGAAACPEKMARIFSAAGIPIREGYGLTESSPGLTINRYEPFMAKLGTVGPPLSNVEIRIDESDGTYKEGEGEILAAGPNIMMGYYKKPEETARVIQEIDGKRWLCTGDVGKLVDGPGNRKYLKITDRKKELLKTSGGKYVAPAPIENRLKEEFLIEQAMVVGEKKKFVSALLIPAEEALKDWYTNEGHDWTNLEEVLQQPEVQAQYQGLIDGLNPQFGKVEQIKKFLLINDQWEAMKADGSKAELTPTLKLKRRVILEKYQKEIEGIYTE